MNFQKKWLIIGITLCSWLVLSASHAWAGASNEGDPSCQVPGVDIVNPAENKFNGPLLIMTDPTASQTTGLSDIITILRYGTTKERKVIQLRTAILPTPIPSLTLLGAKNRLCDLLNGDLGLAIINAFGLPADTEFVFKKNPVRQGRIVGADGSVGPNAAIASDTDLLDGTTGLLLHLSDVVVFAQQPPAS